MPKNTQEKSDQQPTYPCILCALVADSKYLYKGQDKYIVTFLEWSLGLQLFMIQRLCI